MSRISEKEYLDALTIVKAYVEQINKEVTDVAMYEDESRLKISDLMDFMSKQKYGLDPLKKGAISRTMSVLKQAKWEHEYVDQLDEHTFFTIRYGGEKTWETFIEMKRLIRLS